MVRILRPGVLLLTLALIGIVPAPAPTEAAWVITTPTTSTMVGRMPSTVTTGCTLRKNSREGPDALVVTWRLPPEFLQSDVKVVPKASGLQLVGLNSFSVLNNSRPHTDNQMMTEIPLQLLTSTVSLSGRYEFIFQVQKGSWTSGGSVFATMALIGGVTGCSLA